jgi:hypothetical protein
MIFRRYPVAVAAILAAMVLVSCVTKPSPEDEFWNTKFDDKAKAKTLIDAGTASFNNLVNGKSDVDPVDVIEEYFQVALKFDPGNDAATQMLASISAYRSKKLRESLTEARRLLLKANRKDDETLALLMAVNRALALDPKSEEVAKLRTDTDDERKALLAGKIAASKAAIEKAGKATTDAARDDQLVIAWTTIKQALQVAPSDPEANRVQDSLEKQIGSMVANRLAGVDKLITQAKFGAAKTQIDGADDVNTKLGGASTTMIAMNRFALYSAWARYLYEQKDYPAAENRANQALSIKKDKELSAMLQLIADNRNKELATTQFANGLAEIDRLIAANSLLEAQGKISSLAAVVKEEDKQNQLTARRAKIQKAVPELYTQGVQAYRSEKFDQAINLLSVVVAISPDYEQAKDFLDKAKQKKKALEQY